MKDHLIIVCGPTCSGKTTLSIELAKHFNTGIISADSRQIYKELNIGVAKPNHEELLSVPHFLVSSHSIEDEFTAWNFVSESDKILKDLFKKSPIAIMSGGTGFFIKAFSEGLDQLPSSDPELREELNSLLGEKGTEGLYQRLMKLDPVYAEKMDPGNPQRLIRAIEISELTGSGISNITTGIKRKHSFKIIKIGIDVERQELYKMINQRVDKMLEAGLEKEAQDLLIHKKLNALNTVGYKELFDYFEGRFSLEEAVEKIKQNTRNYAKRQMTWFRKDKEIDWLKFSEKPAREELLEKSLKLLIPILG